MAVLVLLMLHQHRDHILIQINILFCIFKQLFQLAIFSGQEAYFVAILSLNQRAHFLVLAEVVLVRVEILEGLFGSRLLLWQC